ncbi:hypothetical protein RRG08_056786 [Elysia crispata]|uniref:Uncharacterized protein n=1 Tax=Elysia crispata TaxID=231223 RepID=A0AAE1ADS6_9GAST|nr:hypothetical protein RRG08_056786 [Elysia crispata]
MLRRLHAKKLRVHWIQRYRQCRVCSAQEYLTCYVPISSKFSQANILACDCREKCETTSYETEVFYADFATRFIKETAIRDNNMHMSDVKTSAIELTIFYKSLTVETLEQQPAISTADVFGKLDGQMGLFLGVSLLSCIEILELFFLLILNYLRACKRYLTCKVKSEESMTP